MTSRDFCFWLQGFFEIHGHKPANEVDLSLNEFQIEMIRSHLNMVFKHEIDPSMGPKPHQDVLNNLHNPIPFDPNVDGMDVLARC